jgi:chaperonin GroEL
MAILTAGQVVTEKSGLELETIGLENLGSARKVLVTQETTILVEGAGNRAAIDARIRDIRAEIGNVTSDYDRDKLEDRLTRLTNGVALIRVGASTASNRQYERTLIDTGIRAVRAAIEEGIVPGGGVALLHAAERVANDTANAEMQPGLGIIRRACEQPLRQLAVNGGGDPEAVVAEILKANSPGFGFNVENGKLTDLLTADIVDPSKAARYALQNATSAAVGLLWSSVAT